MIEGKKIDAMSMTLENPIYAKYLKKKPEFIKKFNKSYARKHKGKNDVDFVNPYDDSNTYVDEYLFLCYITRKYFRDGALVSLAKIFIGIAALVIAILLEGVIPVKGIFKGPLMVLFFGYSLIMIPLSTLFMIAYLVFKSNYRNYITTRDSKLSHIIIDFYDSETDKLQAVNFKKVFTRDSAVNTERKRMRGW